MVVLTCILNIKKQERWHLVYGLKMISQWLKITEILSLLTPEGREGEGEGSIVLYEQNSFQLSFSLNFKKNKVTATSDMKLRNVNCYIPIWNIQK